MDPWKRIGVGGRKTHPMPGGMLKGIPKAMRAHDISCSTIHFTCGDTGANDFQGRFSCFTESPNASSPVDVKACLRYKCV